MGGERHTGTSLKLGEDHTPALGGRHFARDRARVIHGQHLAPVFAGEQGGLRVSRGTDHLDDGALGQGLESGARNSAGGIDREMPAILVNPRFDPLGAIGAIERQERPVLVQSDDEPGPVGEIPERELGRPGVIEGQGRPDRVVGPGQQQRAADQADVGAIPAGPPGGRDPGRAVPFNPRISACRSLTCCRSAANSEFMAQLYRKPPGG